MNRTLQRATAVSLTVCFLLLSGLIYPQIVAHAAHHAHHQAATHATALCSWMCAAGQVLEGVQVVLQTDLGPLTLACLPVFPELSSSVRASSASRGPPSSSV